MIRWGRNAGLALFAFDVAVAYLWAHWCRTQRYAEQLAEFWGEP